MQLGVDWRATAGSGTYVPGLQLQGVEPASIQELAVGPSNDLNRTYHGMHDTIIAIVIMRYYYNRRTYNIYYYK